MEKAIPALPDDIIRTNILTRLDVKSLIRFRSLCKLWNSVICDTDFIKDHLYCTSQNPNDDTLIIIKVFHEHDHYGKTIAPFGYLAILTSSDLSETSLMDVPYSKYGSAEIDMVGSINGLVCLFHCKLDQFIIWNPAIRQAMKINAPARKPRESRSFFGFCWDAMENDYKVVISYNKIGDYSVPLSLYVYSCNLGSWSSPLDSTFSGVFWPRNQMPSAIVIGVPYYSLHPVGTQRLIKFDVESKDFRVLPELYASEYHFVCLVNLKDCLSALVYGGRNYNYDKSGDVHRFDERRGFWSKMYSVGPITGDVFNYDVWRKMNNGMQMFNNTPIFDEEVLCCFRYGGEIVFSSRGAICNCNGSVPYWTYSPNSNGTQRLIKFDVKGKDFRVLPEPYASEDEYVLLVNLKDCLSTLVYGGYGYNNGGRISF
ncbi:F-box/kelch-repeat protein At3g23880-like [Apium graveolens]|uniref:F-box/kelch-repeat protein At3g23880-like n=1 Tax=Apium graveolens TaxID=4045 RepID=UPI003D78FC5F